MEGVEKAVAKHNHDRGLVRLSDDNASVDEMRAQVKANPDHDYKLVGVVS